VGVATTELVVPADEYIPRSVHAERVHDVGNRLRDGQVVIALSIGPERRVEGTGAGQSGDDVFGADVRIYGPSPRVRPRHDDLAAGQNGDAVSRGHALWELDDGLSILAEGRVEAPVHVEPQDEHVARGEIATAVLGRGVGRDHDLTVGLDRNRGVVDGEAAP